MVPSGLFRTEIETQVASDHEFLFVGLFRGNGS